MLGRERSHGKRVGFLSGDAGVGYLRGMSVGAPSETIDPSRARGALSCPHCDASHPLGAIVCDYCGTTLGEPTRRAGMTQRALALDAESAAQLLEREAARKTSSQRAVSVVQVKERLEGSPSKEALAPLARRAASLWERAFVVLTLGLGWFWVRRRLA